jgi:5-methylcytosine-specific restriction enzyme subunit McrC
MSRILRVFEYQTVRVSDRPCEPGAMVTISDAQFDALVRFNDAHGRRFFRVGHRSITFCQYVGYLQVGTLAIEILPKADRRGRDTADSAAWRDFLLEMLRVAREVDLHAPDAAFQTTERSSLLELVVAHFLRETETLVRQGLARSYHEEEANCPMLRGRLLFQEHARHNLARADRCYVRFTTYDRDIVPNQILRTVLDVVCNAPVSAVLRNRVAACLSSLEHVRALQVRPGLFDKLQLGRTTERYRKALALGQLILECLAPALSAGRTPVFALLFDINILWERYIAALFRKAGLTDLSVAVQDQHEFWQEGSRRARRLRPDIVIRRSSDAAVVAIIDTKWKVLEAVGPGDEDLQQMFAYNEMFASPIAVLVYPGSSTAQRRSSGMFSNRKHRCMIAEFDPLSRDVSGGRGAIAGIRRLVHELAEHSRHER